MPAKKTSGGGYGTVASLAATFVDEQLPNVILTAVFSATGPTAAVPVPSTVSSATLLQAVTTGAPTSATVVVQGSLDGSSTGTWTTLPAGKPVGAMTPYPFVRLNCTALSGGTSPTIIVAALATP